MTLIDTSSWIEALRQDGDPDVRGRVQSLLQTGDAHRVPIEHRDQHFTTLLKLVA